MFDNLLLLTCLCTLSLQHYIRVLHILSISQHLSLLHWKFSCFGVILTGTSFSSAHCSTSSSTKIVIVFTFLDYVTIWGIPIFQNVKQRVHLRVHKMFTFPPHVFCPALRSITSSIDILFGTHGKCKCIVESICKCFELPLILFNPIYIDNKIQRTCYVFDFCFWFFVCVHYSINKGRSSWNQGQRAG